MASLLPALMLGGALLAHPATLAAEEVAPAAPGVSSDATVPSVTPMVPAQPAAAPRGETGRSTATTGDPYGSLVPVQTMPRVHLVEPSLTGAFAAPDPSVDGQPSTFERSALAVPRGFELRAPAADAPAAEPLVDRTAPGPAASVDAPAPAAQAEAASAGAIAAAPSSDGPSAGRSETTPDRQVAAMPTAPVQAPDPAPVPDASPVEASPAVVVAPAKLGAAASPPAASSPVVAPTRPAPRGGHRPAAALAVRRHAERPARIETVRRVTTQPATPRATRRVAAERYGALPELTPLPPGVLPAQ